VDSLGEVFVSGHTFGAGFPSVGNSAFNSTDINTTFLMKLDAAGGKILGEVRGIGGLIALDGQSNVYVAGVQGSTATFVPATPGAFQGSFQFNACGGDAQVALECPYQYVTKLDPALSTILYSTYLNGSFGATPSGIAVDAQGEAFVAGSTNSRNYPTTSNAFQPTFIANAPNPPYVCLFFCVFPPPASGYVTKLNSTGTGLIYSTYFSGTQTDTVAVAFFTASGIYLSGNAGSPDLPGFDGYPSQCLPQPYAVRLSADATEVGASRVAPGIALAYDSATGDLLVWTGTDLLAFDPTAPPPAIGCILDSAGLKPVTAVAPGQLLTIFGQQLWAGSNDSVTVSINGLTSPLLYTGTRQINVQAPFEIAGATQASIAFADTQLNLSDSQTLPIVAINPAAFLDDGVALSSLSNCRLNGAQYSGGPIPLAFNADGTRNSCTNPALPGSEVQIFLEGLGVAPFPQATGAITPSPGTPLNLPITFGGGLPATVVSAFAAPGSISGVWPGEDTDTHQCSGGPPSLALGEWRAGYRFRVDGLGAVKLSRLKREPEHKIDDPSARVVGTGDREIAIGTERLAEGCRSQAQRVDVVAGSPE
jgi:uncharacterized protein (TIGR03437 family)